MVKKNFYVIFLLIFCVSLIFSSVPTCAYEITEFDIKAKAGMLVSLDTGDVLYSNNQDVKLYPASITKIMTAVLMLESDKYDPQGKISMTDSVLKTVSGTGSSVSELKSGDTFTQKDLLYMVLMASYGDAAYLAAEYYGSGVDGFIEMMNAKASELGMKNTHYCNPVGLHDKDHYTTVEDTLILATYALKNKTFKEVSDTSRYSFSTQQGKKRTLSTTIFLQDNTTNYYYQYAHGVKTGYTDEAGRCLVSTATYNGYNYICILMGCPPNAGRRYEFIESANLYRWAFKNFSFKKIASSSEPVCEMPVNLSFETDYVPLYFKESFVSVLPTDADESTIVVKPQLNAKSVDAPVKKGQIMGKAEIFYAEKAIGTVDLVAGEDIKMSRLLKIVDSVKKIFSSVYMKVVYAAIAVVVILFIILCIKLNYARIKKRKVRYIPYKGTPHEKTWKK